MLVLPRETEKVLARGMEKVMGMECERLTQL